MEMNEFQEYQLIGTTDKGFLCIVPVLFRKALTGLGKEQFRFVLHLLCARNRENLIYGTLNELAEDAAVSANTASSTIRHLVNNDFIRRAGIRSLMINPSILYSVREAKHRQLKARYYGLERDAKRNDLFQNVTFDDRNLFLKVWADKLSKSTSGFGQKQIQFLLFLLTVVDYEGCIYGTRERLAKRSKVSRETVRDTISLMKEHDLIVRVGNGLLMLNPNIVSRDASVKRRERVAFYNSLKDSQSKKKANNELRKELKNE